MKNTVVKPKKSVADNRVKELQDKLLAAEEDAAYWKQRSAVDRKEIERLKADLIQTKEATHLAEVGAREERKRLLNIIRWQINPATAVEDSKREYFL